MTKAYLIRNENKSTHTLGVLVVDGQRFSILERPWLNNKNNISCIPTGTYKVNYLPQSGSGKYKNCYHILNVPGRSGILIHNGNLVSHSKGCLIIGSRPGHLSGHRAVLSSRPALRRLVKTIGKTSFELEII